MGAAGGIPKVAGTIWPMAGGNAGIGLFHRAARWRATDLALDLANQGRTSQHQPWTRNEAQRS